MKSDLVGYRGMVARDRVIFPQFNVVIDTVNSTKRYKSGDPGTDIVEMFDAMTGMKDRYETAMWLEGKGGQPLEHHKFPTIIIERYNDESLAILGHNTLVEQVRLGRLSWEDMTSGKMLIDAPEAYELLKKRKLLVKSLSPPFVKVRKHVRRAAR